MDASKLNWKIYRYLLAAQESEFSPVAILRKGDASEQLEVGRGNIESLILALRAAYAEARELMAESRLQRLGECEFVQITAERLEQLRRASGAAVELRVAPSWEEQALSPVAQAQLLRIMQEAFDNTHRHAAARQVRVALSVETNCAQLQIEDDGRGFSLSPCLAHFLTSLYYSYHAFQHGLCIMRRLARIAGGTFRIASSPGRGAQIRVRIPLA